MVESEFQRGLHEFRRRLSASGLNIVEQTEVSDLHETFFRIGSSVHSTTIEISRNFLSDFPQTPLYDRVVNDYIQAVSGRFKCNAVNSFYCLCEVPIEVSIKWPITGGVYQNNYTSVVFVEATRLTDGYIAKRSVELGLSGPTVFQIIPFAINSLRAAIDNGKVEFCEAKIYQEVWTKVERQDTRTKYSQAELEQFLCGKAFHLGFMAVDEPREIWADPWDASYLGVAQKDLLLAMRTLVAKGLLKSGSSPQYVRPSDELLSKWACTEKPRDEFQRQPKLPRNKLPQKEELVADMKKFLPVHPRSALIVVDLDHFKAVNESRGHSGGDKCLDAVLFTIQEIVGRKGNIYKWGHGGDEFSVFLPDYTTEEAQVLAEKIRRTIEESKPAEEIPVTASIGVYATDSTGSKSAEEVLEFADNATFESKRRGKNCVTTWPFEPNQR